MHNKNRINIPKANESGNFLKLQSVLYMYAR